MSTPLTGRLLVATPVLTDPNFARAVVLVLDHDEDGTLGVVVNRPTGVDVTAVLPPWSDLTSTPQVVFQGGPVALDSALGLAAVTAGHGEAEPDEEPLGWRRVHERIGLVDLDAPPEILAAELSAMRIFAGYAGWGPGQVEDEIAEGAWYVVDSEPADAFSESPADLWQRVLRRQTGDLAFVATFPDDPSMN
ncbi:MAG TPA: YqgE/AlgH family protein [Actinomycetes bacterium]|jgi:putative transcriptional regulator